MNELCKKTLAEIREMLQTRKVGVLETVDACFSRIEETEPVIEALLTTDKENARAQAAHMDKTSPDPNRTLWGVPLIIKDAISTKGIRTTAASRILDNFMPIYDAFVIRKLKEAGAIILGKANMDEFAMGSSTENSAFKRTRNPWRADRVPGGSSGGSAASVAACQCYGSLGSDTGGSIRQPAAFCGCVGLKPTYGRVSRYGLFAFSSSMDQIGPIARTVRDCALLLNVIAGHDFRDNTSVSIAAENYAIHLGGVVESKPLQNKRIGYCREFFGNGLSEEVGEASQETLRHLESLGAELIEVRLPDPSIASATYYIIAMAEASSNLARYDGVRYGRRAAGVANVDELYLRSRSEGFGPEVKRRIMLGSYVLSSGFYDAYFKKAAQTRRIIHDSYLQALSECDALFMPVAPVPAWQLGTHDQDPLAAYLMDAYTLPINLAGLPGIAVPVGLGRQSRMPIGVQLVGQPFGEVQLLKLAHILEQSLPPIGLASINCRS